MNPSQAAQESLRPPVTALVDALVDAPVKSVIGACRVDSAVSSASPIRALIFDLDGTLIDSMPFHAQSWVAFAEAHGLSLDLPELMRRTTGHNGIECMRVLLGEHLSDEQAQALVHKKEEAYRSLFGPHFHEVRGAIAFMNTARRMGFKIALGTAGDAANVAFALEHLKLPFEFDAISRGDEGWPGKPEPDIFIHAALRLGIAPEHCLVFEDAPLGIEAARRAGMRAVGICTGHSAQDLGGEHVLAGAADFSSLPERFLQTLG